MLVDVIVVYGVIMLGEYSGDIHNEKYLKYLKIFYNNSLVVRECAIFIVVNCNELTLLAFGHDPWGFITL